MKKYKKTLKCYTWGDISTFREDVLKYLASKNHCGHPRSCIPCNRLKNLSLSENSGYDYTPAR